MHDRMPVPTPVIHDNVCPAWCSNDRGGCRGEHSTGSLGVAATASGPLDVGIDGANFPAVNVRGTWNRAEREPVALSLHIGTLDGSLDTEVFLRPSEARQLIENAQLILGQVEVGS